MQTTTKQLTPTSTELTLIADEALLTRVHTAVVAELGRNVQVAGFRKGHAPASVVEKAIDPQQLQSRFLDGALSEMYSQAIVEQQLRPVGQPDVSVTKFVPFQALEAKMTVATVGTVKPADYKKFRFTPAKVTVSGAEVDQVVDDLRARTAEKKAVDRAVKEGDEAVIDFTGVDTKSGEAIQGADGSAYPLMVGSNTFIPGFEPELIGLKKGESKTFEVTFPKDYGAKELQNKKVTFTVTVKDVHEVVLPAADDAFAATVGPFNSLADLRADIKKQLITEKETQAQRALENDILTELAKKSTAEIPAELIEDETERMLAEEKQSLLYRGQTWQEYLLALGTTEEAHRTEIATQAELRVKTGIVLGEVAQTEDIQVTEEEYQVRYDEAKAMYKNDAKMQEELAKPENQRDIASRILTEKTIAKLVDYATK